MSTLNRIKAVLDKYNTDHNYQANLSSDCMRQWIAKDIYDAVMKQDISSDTATYNDTQMEFFSNLDRKETK